MNELGKRRIQPHFLSPGRWELKGVGEDISMDRHIRTHCLQVSSFPTAASQSKSGFRCANLGLGGSGKRKMQNMPSRDLQLMRESNCSHGVIQFMGNETVPPQEAWLDLLLPPD